MQTRQTAHLSDFAAARSYVERHPRMVEAVEIAGIRTTLGVPMVKEKILLGIIGIFRQDVRPFNDKQIALVEFRKSGRHRHGECAAAPRPPRTN